MLRHVCGSPILGLVLAFVLSVVSPGQERGVPAAAQDPLAAAERAIEQEDFAAAARHYTEVLEAASSVEVQLRARRGRARAREGLRQFQDAVADLDAVLAATSGDGLAHFARGRVRSQLQRFDEALADFDGAVAQLPADALVHAWRGMTLVQLGRAAAGRAALERAVDLGEDSAWVLFWLGRSHADEGDHARARVFLLRAQREEPDAVTLRELADVDYELEKYDTALLWIDRAIALEPDDGGGHLSRAWILAALGRRGEAQTALRNAKRLEPSYADVELPQDGLLLVLGGLAPLAVLVLAALLVYSLVAMLAGARTRSVLESVDERYSPARYDGKAGDLFALYLKNVVLTLLTLGIYRSWAKVAMLRFRYQHTSVGGGRFDYHATGAEKFVGFLKGLLVLAPFAGGLYLLYAWAEPEFGAESAFNLCFWAFAAVLYGLRPLVLVGAQRFNLGRTSFNNLRLRFTGTVGAAYRVYGRDLLLIVCTLGFYTAWHQCNVRRFRLEHTKLGDAAFGYTGDGGDLFVIHLKGYLLTMVTLGLYAPWYIANLHRFHLERTTFRGKRLRSRLEGIHVVSSCAPALLLVVLTLGLALPLVLHRWHELVTNTTSYAAVLDLDELQAIHDAKASSTLEGVGEAGDAIAEIGDLFGA